MYGLSSLPAPVGTSEALLCTSAPESPPHRDFSFLRRTKLWGIFSQFLGSGLRIAWMDFGSLQRVRVSSGVNTRVPPPSPASLYSQVSSHLSTWAQSHMLQETERWTVLSAAMHLCYQEGHSKAKLVVGFFIFKFVHCSFTQQIFLRTWLVMAKAFTDGAKWLDRLWLGHGCRLAWAREWREL